MSLILTVDTCKALYIEACDETVASPPFKAMLTARRHRRMIAREMNKLDSWFRNRYSVPWRMSNVLYCDQRYEDGKKVKYRKINTMFDFLRAIRNSACHWTVKKGEIIVISTFDDLLKIINQVCSGLLDTVAKHLVSLTFDVRFTNGNLAASVSHYKSLISTLI